MGTWSMEKPSRQAIEMQRGGTRHLLQVGLRQAEIATAPESKRPHPLGERALNAGALRVEPATCFALQIGPHAIDGGLPRLRLQLEAAWSIKTADEPGNFDVVCNG
jgi:hypothetical protein